MNLSKIASAIKAEDAKLPNHSVLLYGPSKTGKTRLGGTAAQIPEFERIYWMDTENGATTLANMGLTQAEMEKVELFQFPDTRQNPIAIESIRKLFLSKTARYVCDVCGKVDCLTHSTPEMKKDKKFPGTRFLMSECTHNDLVVVDTLSQLGDSALALAYISRYGTPSENDDLSTSKKLGFDEYGMAGNWLNDILSVAQQCQHTNFLFLAHELLIEEEINGVTKDKIVPRCGTRAFSNNVAGKFGTVVRTTLELGKHRALSQTKSAGNAVTGSRVNAVMEGKEPNLREIFIAGGILKERS